MTKQARASFYISHFLTEDTTNVSKLQNAIQLYDVLTQMYNIDLVWLIIDLPDNKCNGVNGEFSMKFVEWTDKNMRKLD